MVGNELEAAKREFGKSVLWKEHVTPEMILSICNRFAGPNANLSEPRLAAVCVTAYSAFLYYELASLRCFEVFAILLLGINVFKSKADVYRDGAHVLLSKSEALFLAVFRYLTDTSVLLI